MPVRAYELIDTKESVERPVLDLIETFEDGLDHYFKQDWYKALDLFERSESMELHFKGRNTTPSMVFMERCRHFMEQPPKKDWDGVWKMVTK